MNQNPLTKGDAEMQAHLVFLLFCLQSGSFMWQYKA